MLFEYILLIVNIKRNIMCNIISQSAHIIGSNNSHQNVRRNFGCYCGIRVKRRFGVAQHCILINRAALDRRIINTLNICTAGRIGVGYADKLGSVTAFNKNAYNIIRYAEYLFHLCNAADIVEIISRRIIRRNILLCNEENAAVGGHGGIYGVDGFFPYYVKMYHHFRVNDQPSEGKQRHISDVIFRHVILHSGVRRQAKNPLSQNT